MARFFLFLSADGAGFLVVDELVYHVVDGLVVVEIVTLQHLIVDPRRTDLPPPPPIVPFSGQFFFQRLK